MNDKRNVLMALGLALALTVLLAAACIIALPEGPAPVTTREAFLPAWPEGTPEPPSRGIGVLYGAECRGCGDYTDFSNGPYLLEYDPQDIEDDQDICLNATPVIESVPCVYGVFGPDWTSIGDFGYQQIYAFEIVPAENMTIGLAEFMIYRDVDSYTYTEPITVTIRSGDALTTALTIGTTTIAPAATGTTDDFPEPYFLHGLWDMVAPALFSPGVSLTAAQTYWVVLESANAEPYLLPGVSDKNFAAWYYTGCDASTPFAINCADDITGRPAWLAGSAIWLIEPTPTPTFIAYDGRFLPIALGEGAPATPTNTPTHTATPTNTPFIPPLFTATPTPTVTPTSANTAEPNWTETLVSLQTATPTTTASATPTSAAETPTLLPTSTPSYYFIEILSSQGSPAVDYNQRGGAGVYDEFVELRVFPSQTLTGWSMELGGCTYTFATDNYTGPIKVIWADQFRSGANVCPGFDHPGVAILRDQNGIIQDVRLYWTYGDGNSWRALYWTDPGGAWIPALPSPGLP